MNTDMIFEKSLTEELEEIDQALQEMADNPNDERKAQAALRKIRALSARFKMTRHKMDEIEKKLGEATDGGTLDDIAKLTDAAMTVISIVNRTYNQIKRIKAGKKAIEPGRDVESRHRGTRNGR